MSGSVSRRAFLVGAAGAAAAGWALLRDRGLSVDDLPDVATRTDPPPTTTSSIVPSTTRVAAPSSSSSTSTTTSAAPPAVHIEALCREAWEASVPTGDFTGHTIERMTVHHTARMLEDNRGAPAAIRGHQRFHQLDRGWADIAYHFVIDLEGNVYECRPVDAVGDTGTNYDPTGHFLVCCEGDFRTQATPAAMVDALVNVLAWASTRFAVSAETIRGHRDVAATTCPGDNLYALIESGELARAVRARVAAGGAELRVVCGDEADARIEAIET